ncbi:MAG: RsmD family RNA methyltransferase [Coriobacteriales bacterium]|jgi:16S rRNA (guanine966-N2)-methyltransferase|nr:RsmD family RNA methyltransferase [Coriobacteriales bacterium]
MRIIAGRYKGQTIKALAGETTRPTTNRVKEAWASTITSLSADGFAQARVLDAFAGSGALGLEALSRGASHVTFCERNRRALEVLKANRARILSARPDDAPSDGTDSADVGDSGSSMDGEGNANSEGSEGSANSVVLPLDVLAPQSLATLKRFGPYDLVFLDPPYSYAPRRIEDFLHALMEAGLLKDNSLITYEHRKKSDNKLSNDAIVPTGFQILSQKTYATTQITYLHPSFFP